jgi:predicted DNA-binding protein
MSEEQRKSVHYRLPLFSREKLKKLAARWGTTMTGVLVRLIERAKL